MIWAWFLNPKNLLLTLLAAAVLALGVTFFIQRANNAILGADLKEKKVALENADLQIKQYRDNLQQIEVLNKKVDLVRKETARTAGAIEDLRFDTTQNGGKNEKAVNVYNSMVDDLMQLTPAKTSGKSVSNSADAGAAKVKP
jgi:type II secretory pathway pseudopilin PulG